MDIDNSFDLSNDYTLIAFEDAFAGAKCLLNHEDLSCFEIVFRGISITAEFFYVE